MKQSKNHGVYLKAYLIKSDIKKFTIIISLYILTDESGSISNFD